MGTGTGGTQRRNYQSFIDNSFFINGRLQNQPAPHLCPLPQPRTPPLRAARRLRPHQAAVGGAHERGRGGRGVGCSVGGRQRATGGGTRGLAAAPEGRLPEEHHDQRGEVLHPRDALEELPAAAAAAVRAAQRPLRRPHEVHRARAEGGGDQPGRPQEAADFGERGGAAAEVGVRVVPGVVPAPQVHVLPAQRGQDELQGALHRVQEQVHPLPPPNDPRGAPAPPAPRAPGPLTRASSACPLSHFSPILTSTRPQEIYNNSGGRAGGISHLHSQVMALRMEMEVAVWCSTALHSSLTCLPSFESRQGMQPSSTFEQQVDSSFPAMMPSWVCSGAFSSRPAISTRARSVSAAISSSGISSKLRYLGGDPRICVAMSSANSLMASSASSSCTSGSVASSTTLACSPTPSAQGRWTYDPQRQPSECSVMALRMRTFSWSREISSLSSSPMFFTSLSSGKILPGSVRSRISANFPFASSCPKLSTSIGSSLSRNRFPSPPTNFTKRSLLATKSVSQLTSRRTALRRQGVMKEAMTPSRVSLSALFQEVRSPFCLSHWRAASQLEPDSSRAFLHSPIGALVSSRSRLMDSMGTLRVENTRLTLLNIIFQQWLMVEWEGQN